MTSPPHLRIVGALEAAETLSDGSDAPPPSGPAPAAPAREDDPLSGVVPAEPAGGAGGEPPEPPGQHPPASLFDDWGSLDLVCGLLPRTDLGNAERFIKRSGRDFLWVAQWGWLAWDGKRWNPDEADALLARAVHEVIKRIAQEAEAVKESGRDVLLDEKKGIWLSDRIRGWCLASQRAAAISCVARLAQAYLTASPDDFDRDPMAFNVSNGTLRVARRSDAPYVSFHPHAREDRMSKLSPVNYDPTALRPLYDRFLERVQPDPAMRRHLHAWGGLALTALPVAKFAFWYGTGRNGKSTLIDAWNHIYGGYGQTIPIESFLDEGRTRRGGEASPDIAALVGTRALRTSEPEKRTKLAESLIKQVTGGEPMRARHLNMGFFEFTPVFKLTMQGNYKARIDGTDEGIWARILLVPWAVMVPEAERDIHLLSKLRAEASGILNALLDGLCDYLDHGLSPPQEVIDATKEYREDSDPLGRFLAECCVLTPPDQGAKVEAAPLYRLFKAWAAASGEPAFSPKSFSKGLQDHGIRRHKSSGIYYLGIDTTRQVSDFAGKEFDDEPPQRRRD